MKYVIPTILFFVGLVNFYPVIGFFAPGNLNELYGIDIENADIEILLRHRALLFGLLGAFIMSAAFVPAFRLLACLAALCSMVAFVFIAVTTSQSNQAINFIVWVDIVASAAVLIVLGALYRGSRNGP